VDSQDAIERHDSRRDHVLRRPLEAAVESAGSTGAADVAEAVLRALDEQRIIAYTPRDALAILTPAGRVLVIVAENPHVTLREISVALGVTEANVAKSVGKLVASNVIARTKVNGRNTYRVNLDVLESHPDLRRYGQVLASLQGKVANLEQ
jgi:hypothetical protein